MEHSFSFKIFLVDDDFFCLNLYEQQLKSMGYCNVRTFSSGYECIEKLDDLPDIIFLDHDMDSVGGLEVLKMIKAINPHIYVVFLSGREDASIISAALNQGAFEFIVKSNNDMLNMKMVISRIAQIKTALKKMNGNAV